MERRDVRRRPRILPVVQSLEGRQLLSAVGSLPAGYASEVASQSFRNARPAPQSPSPHTTRVSVSTDRPSYAPGQPIHLTVTQSVAGNTPVNTGPMGNFDVVVSRRGRELWRASDHRGPVVASHVLVTLQPGQSRQTTVTWDGRARDGSIVTGPVEIRAVVDRVPSPPRPLQITPTPTARPSNVPAPARSGGVPVARRDALDRLSMLRQQQERPLVPTRPTFERPIRPIGAHPLLARRFP
jgi:hypothetical protein